MHASPLSFEVYIDRSLGRNIVSAALRALGITVHTEHDIFGDRTPPVPDEEWLERVGREGWVAFTKDTRIRYRASETDALVRFGVRAFVLSSGNATGRQQADIYVANLPAIQAAATSPGPYVYAVRRGGIERLASP